MTLRHKVSATVLAAAVALGCTALPGEASAAPASPTFAVLSGRDGLAVYANAALDAWVTYSKTTSAKSLADFNTVRDAVAGEAAHRLGLDATAMKAAWRRADTTHQVALLAAFTQLGTAYRRNSSTPAVGFDCSGLTSWAWAQVGRPLVRQSASQMRAARVVTRETAQAGDLVYYPGHVMMYLGFGNAVIHSPYTGRNVEVAFLSKSRVNSVRFGNPMG